MEYEAARGRETRSGWASLIKRLLNMPRRVAIVRKTWYDLIVGRHDERHAQRGRKERYLP